MEQPDQTRIEVDLRRKESEAGWQSLINGWALAVTPEWFEWLGWVLVLAAFDYLARQSGSWSVRLIPVLSVILLWLYFNATFFRFEVKGLPLIQSGNVERALSMVYVSRDFRPVLVGGELPSERRRDTHEMSAITAAAGRRPPCAGHSFARRLCGPLHNGQHRRKPFAAWWPGARAERAMMTQIGHRSVTMVRRYIREASVFTDNAAAGLLWAGTRRDRLSRGGASRAPVADLFSPAHST
jgi:hypothetical protein